jgi:hypothetical protein
MNYLLKLDDNLYNKAKEVARDGGLSLAQWLRNIIGQNVEVNVPNNEDFAHQYGLNKVMSNIIKAEINKRSKK